MSEAADFTLDREQPAQRRTLGERLREAREARGLTLADVSARTRIPQRMLAAIETDRHEALPNLTFALGFVRSFAREVGLDPEEAARQHRAENTRVPHVTPPVALEPLEAERVPSPALAWGSAAAVALLIAGLAAWGFGAFDRDAVVAGPAPAAVTPADTPVAIAAPAPAPAPVAAPLAAAPASTGAAALPVRPPAAGGGVTLTATEDVWLQVKDRVSGERLMSGILTRGQTYDVPGGDPVLWTGKAGALTVSVAGRALPPLGGPVETVRDVPLTAAALLARGGAPAPAASAPR